MDKKNQVDSAGSLNSQHIRNTHAFDIHQPQSGRMSEQEAIKFFYECIRASGLDPETVAGLMDFVYRYEFELPTTDHQE